MSLMCEVMNCIFEVVTLNGEKEKKEKVMEKESKIESKIVSLRLC